MPFTSYGSFYLIFVTCWFSNIARGVTELISGCDVITFLWIRHRKTHFECCDVCTVYSSQSIEVCLTEMERPCVDCIDKRGCTLGYGNWITYCNILKWRERLGLSLEYYKREICEFWMIQQKLKEAVQIGALSVQYNSPDVKSRISMDAELKINLLLTSRLEISSVTPRSILENQQVTHMR